MNPETGSGEKVKNGNSQGELVQFSDHPAFNFGMAISWLVALCAVAISAFLWWLNMDTKTTVQERQKQKDAIISEITSPANVEIEKKAANFKSAVNSLKKAQSEKVSINTFLKHLYTKVTNDVVLTNITVTKEGTVSLNGTTGSYRSVADLIMALKSWPQVTNVDLKSVSMQENDKDTVDYVFAVDAKLVKNTLNTVSTTSITGTNNAGGAR